MFQALLHRYHDLEAESKLADGTIPSAPLRTLCVLLYCELPRSDEVDPWMNRLRARVNRLATGDETIRFKLVRLQSGELEVGFWPVKPPGPSRRILGAHSVVRRVIQLWEDA